MMKNVWIIVAVVAGVIVLGVVAFFVFAKPTSAPSNTSGDQMQNMNNASTTDSGSAQSTTAVTIANLAFSPASITVKLGQTVTWTNNDSSTHTVTANDGSFNSGNMAKGASFSHTFDKAGTFSYHCNIHPSMKATVVVQ